MTGGRHPALATDLAEQRPPGAAADVAFPEGFLKCRDPCTRAYLCYHIAVRVCVVAVLGQ